MNEIDIKQALEKMVSDPNMITKSGYRANAEQWPDNRISFIDMHLTYLKAHPAVDPELYLSNLRLKIRK